VAHLVQLDPSTVTGILQRLVRKGLLKRELHPGDSRRVRLSVRAKAKPFLQPSAGIVESAIASALAPVSPARQRAARGVLSAIADALDRASLDAAARVGPPRRAR
jgi:DNA-binding MarR family transcriptional regulator